MSRKTKCLNQNCEHFIIIKFKFFLSAHNNRLIETALLRIHKKCFGDEIRIYLFLLRTLNRGLHITLYIEQFFR